MKVHSSGNWYRRRDYAQIRRKRCNNKLLVSISSVLFLSLIAFLSPLVRSFRCSNGLRYHNRNRNRNHWNYYYRSSSSFINTPREAQSVVASSSSSSSSRSTSCSSSSTSLPVASVLRELDKVDDIKEGSLILSRVETSLGCHDLKQPYFHKAVVLVLDHDPDDFTQGVLLNRASDLILDGRDIVYVDEDDDDDDEMYKGMADEYLQNDESLLSSSSSSSSSSSLSSSSQPPPAIQPPSSTNWRIHFGGDIGGWYEDVPQLLCLHGISSETARMVSDPIFGGGEDNGDDANVGDVYITSHKGALSLVESGEATSDMFYTFSGFCGWEKDQLQNEVDRGSWCLASFAPEGDGNCSNTTVDATASATGSNNKQNTKPNQRQQQQQHQHVLMDLIDKYSWKNPNYNPESGGLEFWHDVMADLGKDNVGTDLPRNPQPFSDLMMKEWATQRLLMTPDTGSSGDGSDNDDGDGEEDDKKQDVGEPTSQIEDEDIFRALKAASDRNSLSEGAILRGSSAPSSPYLVSGQLFHKSTILVLQDNPQASIGVLLNLPTKNVYVLTVEGKDYQIPIRYGGYSGKDESEEEDPRYFWFHDHRLLKEEEIGLPVSFSNEFPGTTAEDLSCIYVCELEEVRNAIGGGLANPDDFLLVRGFCAWEKQDNGSAGGLTGQILNGNLEDTQFLQKMPQTKRKSLWTSLLEQRRLVSEDCLKHNLALSRRAWETGGGRCESDDAAGENSNNKNSHESIIRRVFDSTVTVSELADDALYVWMKIFLLGKAVYYPEDL